MIIKLFCILISKLGKFYFNEGEFYSGEFKDSRIEGKGDFIINNHVIKNRHEFLYFLGKYLLSNGNKYEGEFEDGKFNGQGKIFLETQKKKKRPTSRRSFTNNSDNDPSLYLFFLLKGKFFFINGD